MRAISCLKALTAELVDADDDAHVHKSLLWIERHVQELQPPYILRLQGLLSRSARGTHAQAQPSELSNGKQIHATA